MTTAITSVETVNSILIREFQILVYGVSISNGLVVKSYHVLQEYFGGMCIKNGECGKHTHTYSYHVCTCCTSVSHV